MPPSQRNIEIKARVDDLVQAEAVARRVATDKLGVERQTDTYFHALTGRLKLREIDGQARCLIGYHRPDQGAPKPSDYRIVPVSAPEPIKAILASTLGVRVVVIKERIIYLRHHVRIHLDRVNELGDFVEFEAVMGNSAEGNTEDSILDRLIDEFGISASDLEATSYSDMLCASAG